MKSYLFIQLILTLVTIGKLFDGILHLEDRLKANSHFFILILAQRPKE